MLGLPEAYNFMSHCPMHMLTAAIPSRPRKLFKTVLGLAVRVALESGGQVQDVEEIEAC